MSSEETLNFELFTGFRMLQTMGAFKVGLNASLHHDMAISLGNQGVECYDLGENCPHMLIGSETLSVALLV